ncbi:hypothetical protein C482_00300 [Natrialba chahannaoensis JCM 10990]|uniref:Protein-glutamine gamma-glutamyltransferase-like C-terminal domain-containing protein n=1 Tax=Natrialba chahannaoensis JCM 10990 TaxID=1227492 RepID=M0B5M3_9EURY|nr:DUF4129 domain-containing protein [Natrialba chahannaoensis]ELZ06216.1 hypothetical protein C482_00300 [Natrialba chahannaoensis JCM 10990]
MSDARRLLFVAGCLVCLLAAASALPAADPRLDAPGSDENVSTTGSWDTLAESADPIEMVTNVSDTGDSSSESAPEDAGPSHAIELKGDPEPGGELTVVIADSSPVTDRTIEVDGERAGETEHDGRVDITVPYAEEMTIDVVETNQSRTVDIETDAAIEPAPGAAPNRDLEIAAAVGSTPVESGTVYLDDEQIGTTAENGTATVPLPETAEPTTVRVERGPVSGERTIDVQEPTVEFASPLLLPGMPAPVQVSADGTGVPNASVVTESGSSATTGDDGTARIRLPFDDEATVTSTVGAETATASVDDLYLRLTTLVVIVPGFVLGAVVTYVRVVPSKHKHNRQQLSALFVGLAGIFDDLATVVGKISHSLRNASLPRVGPTLKRLLSLRHLGRSLPRLVPSLPSTPSVGSLLPSIWSLSWGRSSDRKRRLGSILSRRRDTDDADNDTADDHTDTESAATGSLYSEEPLEPRSPRSEVRAIWHAVLDRLRVHNRETQTPGEVTRDALERGYPSVSMRRLATVFRELEYGDREPSADRVLSARAAAANVMESDPDETAASADTTGAEETDSANEEGEDQ